MIMSGIRSGPSEKRLASQFIARFFRHFPALADDSLDAIFDLCEDEDASVRLTFQHCFIKKFCYGYRIARVLVLTKMHILDCTCRCTLFTKTLCKD